MKRILTIAAIFLACVNAADAQEAKTGWNFGPLPAVGYNTDLGLQAGALCDIYYYGDGAVYPDYIHKFNVEASYYTKGSGIFHLFYDSKYLLPGLRLTAAVTYMPNRKYSFYGFNGAASPYFPEMDSNRSDAVAFYSIRRNLFRALADFQGKIAGNWGWAAGFAFKWYAVGDIDLKGYDAGNTLYRRYIDNGIISADEAGGGKRMELKAGAVYDTRDHEAAPNRGVWFETCLIGSPDIFGGGRHYLKLSTHFRHYVTLLRDRLVFAYHLAYQGTVAGQAPFYVQQDIATLYLRQVNSEGLGSINTVRGTLYNRMIGDAYAWANAELRIKLLNFDLIGQHWYVATNPFFDAGAVVRTYRLDRMKGSGDGLIYSGNGEKLHSSAGIGLKLAMNDNFIISVEGAKPLSSQDGPFGMNIGLNYIF